MKATSCDQVSLLNSNLSPNIVVVGSINCDITTYVAEFPTPMETVMGNNASLTLGGKGLNQAVAASLAGGSVHMIACTGDDQFGKLAKLHLAEHGVGIEHVHSIKDVTTGTATILVNADAQNMIAVAPGANACLSQEHILAAEDAIAQADALVVQMEVPLETISVALHLARKHKVRTIVNPAPASLDICKLLALADIVTPNETEIALLSGVDPDDNNCVSEGIERLRGFGASTVIVTRGEDGCSVALTDDLGHIPAFSVDAVDPTGAGDVFNGVLAVALAQTVDKAKVPSSEAMAVAVQRASAAAAISVTKPLAQGAAPTVVEIDAFITSQILEKREELVSA